MKNLPSKYNFLHLNKTLNLYRPGVEYKLILFDFFIIHIYYLKKIFKNLREKIKFKKINEKKF